MHMPYIQQSHHKIFYFRLAIPTDLRKVIGRDYLRQTLKTKDPNSGNASHEKLPLSFAYGTRWYQAGVTMQNRHYFAWILISLSYNVLLLRCYLTAVSCENRRLQAKTYSSKDCFMSQKPRNIGDIKFVETLKKTISRLENDLCVLNQAQVENEKSITFLNGILEQSLAGIYVINNGKFEYVNKVFADIFGYASPSEIVQTIELQDLVSPECRDMVLENVRKRTTDETNEMRYTFAGLRKDGSRNLVEVHGRAMVIAGIRSVIGLLLDMTDFNRVTSLAFYDSLTNLPNRALFNDRLAQSIKQAQRSQEPFALLFMDLDGFKNANDSLGHAAGDHVLQEFSKRLLLLFRESDTVARLGGDEFVAIISSANNRADVAKLATRILECMEIPIQFEEHTVTIGVSIGISVFPHDSMEMEDLLNKADSAMYEAKKTGKNTYRFFY